MPANKKYFLNWNEFEEHVDTIVKEIKAHNFKFTGVGGFPRGGLPLAVTLSHRLEIPFISLDRMLKPVHHTEHAHYLLVDDISDSGTTFLKMLEQVPFPALVTCASLVRREGSAYIPKHVGKVIDSDDWIVFPWEERII